MFGLLYELEVEDKPEYQWYGNFYPVFAISELAKKYRADFLRRKHAAVTSKKGSR